MSMEEPTPTTWDRIVIGGRTWERVGEIACCVDCGAAREGTISFALKHERTCKDVTELAKLVGLAEARRVVDLADSVSVEDARSLLCYVASRRAPNYTRAIFYLVERGEPLPRTANELRAILEALRWQWREEILTAGLR